MSRILITGGAGFIGRSLVEKLLDDNHEVVIYDHLSGGDISNVPQWMRRPNLTFIHADMLDTLRLYDAVKECEVVCHMAANPDVRTASKDTKTDFNQNIVATYKLMEAMRKSDSCKRIIFASTSTVYGEPDQTPTPETYGILKPISLYGASKLACESIISGYCYMFGMAAVVLRLANVVGPNSTHGVIYDFIMKLMKDSKSLAILGNGMQNKSYVFIDDCVSAFEISERLLVSKTGTFEVFNVGSDDQITVLDIARIIINELALPDVEIAIEGSKDGRGWPGDVTEMLLDSSKLKSHGWQVKSSSKEAVTKTASGIASMLQYVEHVIT